MRDALSCSLHIAGRGYIDEAHNVTQKWDDAGRWIFWWIWKKSLSRYSVWSWREDNCVMLLAITKAITSSLCLQSRRHVGNCMKYLSLCQTMVKVKVKIWTLAIAPLTWVSLVTSSALQSRKWQLIGMSQWCRSALCGHLLPALTDNWTQGAASIHTIAPISHTRPSPRSRSYYWFHVSLRVGGWVGLNTQQVSNLLKVACSGPGVSRTRNLLVTSPILYQLDHCTRWCQTIKQYSRVGLMTDIKFSKMVWLETWVY